MVFLDLPFDEAVANPSRGYMSRPIIWWLRTIMSFDRLVERVAGDGRWRRGLSCK
jgi:hypothetical protein